MSNAEGSSCGGVISESYLDEVGPEGVMMSYILPDDQFAKYQQLKEAGDDKAAKAIFERYAWSLV